MTIIGANTHVFQDDNRHLGGRRKLPRKKGATMPFHASGTKTEHLKGNIRDRQQEFLEAFIQLGTIKTASDACGFTSNCVQDWRSRDPEFEDKFTQAKIDATDYLEAEARRRATGYKKDVWYKGEIVGVTTEYSEGLLKTLLRAYRPERFSENINIKQESTINMKLVIEELRDDLGQQDLIERARTSAAKAAVDRVAHMSSN